MQDATVPQLPLAVPFYKEVKRQMMESLTRGEWKPAEAIPAERRLSQRYGVSIGTVRKAIDELVAQNILIRQQGRGTYVASHNRDRMLFYFFHITAADGPREYPEVRLAAFGKAKADRVVAERLRIGVGDAVFRIRNLLLLSGAPIIVDDLTVSVERFAGLTEKQLKSRRSTVYQLYQEAFGISVVKTSERLRAVLAEPGIAGLLGLARGAPVLQIRRVALSYHDEPVEYRVSWVNTARYEYYADIRA